jgi:Ni,Fe-hydrogenase III small subunit
MIWKLAWRIGTGIPTEPHLTLETPSADGAHTHPARTATNPGQALTIRQVDAGSCNGCELEIHALGNPYYNIEGPGHPLCRQPAPCRHAAGHRPGVAQHGNGPARTYDATPEPKLVVAVGDCACDGGIFGESYASCGRVANVIPVDVTVPGCPPEPLEILRGILLAVRRRVS